MSDYWSDAIAQAAEDCDLALTPEQLKELADAAESAHEHYYQAHYTPPSSDRIKDEEDKHRRETERLRAEHERREEAQQRRINDLRYDLNEYSDALRKAREESRG